jgi:membrane protease subunit HflK
VAGKTIIHNADPGPWGKPKGPVGGGNGGGWQPGGGGGRGRGTPPGDFDDWLADFKRHMDGFFGGGHGNRGIALGLAVFFFLWLASGVYQLQPGEQGVVLRFGKFNRIASSGLRYHVPAPFENVEIVNSEVIRMETLGGDPSTPPHGGSNGTGDDEILMLTGDENIINLSFNVQWKVSDAQKFLFNTSDPRQTVRAVAESAMREVIGRTPIDSALTEGKSSVQEETRKLTQDTLDHYKAGVQILQVNLLDASFPQAVVDAARDVQAARADQERARNEAEAYTNDILPRARGQATRMVQEAEAYKQQVVANAEGDAARFTSVYLQYKQAQDITRKRIYLETMEKILAGTTKVIIDSKTGTVPYLPLPAVRPHGEAEAP